MVGRTAQEALAALTENAANLMFPDGLPIPYHDPIDHELRLINQLGYAPYFLKVNAIFAGSRRRGILCQGRGSAANSSVCYMVVITSIDPIHHGPLFERFVSSERMEPPDIDVDFEHERREEIIPTLLTSRNFRPSSRANPQGGGPVQMADERFEKLTARQKACLRQVSQLRVACEIAAQLGTSEAMVNKLIKEACGRIGVNRRKEAARLFADYEARQGVPKVDVHIGDLGLPSSGLFNQGSPGSRVSPPVVQEARASFEGDLQTFAPAVPPSEKGTRDQAKAGLELSFRLTAIFAMICLAALLLSKLARTLEALLNLNPR